MNSKCIELQWFIEDHKSHVNNFKRNIDVIIIPYILTSLRRFVIQRRISLFAKKDQCQFHNLTFVRKFPIIQHYSSSLKLHSFNGLLDVTYKPSHNVSQHAIQLCAVLIQISTFYWKGRKGFNYRIFLIIISNRWYYKSIQFFRLQGNCFLYIITEIINVIIDCLLYHRYFYLHLVLQTKLLYHYLYHF